MKPFNNQSYGILLGLLMFLIVSCTFNTKYNKERWQTSDSGFPSEYRENMLNDLTRNHKLKGLTMNQVIQLLGHPDRIENNLIIYNVIIKYGGDTDVEYSKKLKLSFSKDSIITSFNVVEWHKN